MADEPQQIRGINWRETFPFTHLFRAFRIAVHPSKLMLGLIALLSLYAGGRLLDGLWSPRHLAVPGPAGPAGEVYLYQQNAEAGGSGAQFDEARRAQRQASEEAYAQTLGELDVEKDPQRARDAARDADKLGAVK